MALEIIAYRDERGRTPFLDWASALPKKERRKIFARVKRLGLFGHKLRRPEADYLKDDIYELRISFQRLQYRILYFFDGNRAVVLTHGFIKKGLTVPNIEIERAVRRKLKYQLNPSIHTAEMEL